MSRELKFRVWDKLEKRFYDSKSNFQDHYVISLNGKFHNLHNGVGGDEVIIQQYTGLKDKNGKEIYEGDFIKYEFPTDQQVIMRKSRGCQNIVAVRWSNEEEDNHPGFRIVDLMGQYGSCEIIGNIFENPELLSSV
jgi:uncharacterized phage protein (TIGR01671 family)